MKFRTILYTVLDWIYLISSAEDSDYVFEQLWLRHSKNNQTKPLKVCKQTHTNTRAIMDKRSVRRPLTQKGGKFY